MSSRKGPDLDFEQLSFVTEARRLLKKMVRNQSYTAKGHTVVPPHRPHRPNHDDGPVLEEHVVVEVVADHTGKSYEEANWAKLSPNFRRAHNRLRAMRGLAPIPPPKIDLYVPPGRGRQKLIDADSPEGRAAAQQFLRGEGVIRMPGSAGFQDRGLTRANWRDP